jgi:arsenate reductase (glutaredoxin)
MITLYGIKNCTTVKKAQQWLDGQGVIYRFHDFRRDGLTLALLQYFLVVCDWHLLINRRSSTWKTLSDTQRAELDTSAGASVLLMYPTLIKRPLLAIGDNILVGFDPAAYQIVLNTVTQ